MAKRQRHNGPAIVAGEVRIPCEFARKSVEGALVEAYRAAERAKAHGADVTLEARSQREYQLLYLAARKLGLRPVNVPNAALHISRDLWERADKVWQEHKIQGPAGGSAGEARKNGARLWLGNDKRALGLSPQTYRNLAARQDGGADQAPAGQPPTLYELDALVGLAPVKAQMHQRVAVLRNAQRRRAQGLRVPPVSNHLVFTGAPGTGKTTVARLVGAIYQELGLLRKGHVVEVDRNDLIGAYVGHTEKQTAAIIKKALHGVLFIDEAYALVKEDSGTDFGRDAVNSLLKAMEDYRDALVVVVAGYTDEMKQFIKSNPGLASRFKTIVPFPDYDAAELTQILNNLCAENHYVLSGSAERQAKWVFGQLYEGRDRTFSNGRLARNMFELAVQGQADRLAQSPTEPGRDALMRLEAADLPGPDALI